MSNFPVGLAFSNQPQYQHFLKCQIVEGADVWAAYETFCVERNPWDKTLSHWAMRRDRAGGDLSLDAYLADGDFCSDIDRYCDAAGRLLVGSVVRYEDLAAGLGQVFEQIGIPFDGDLGVSAKSDHRRDRRPYRDVFSPTQRRIVARVDAPRSGSSSNWR